MDGSPPKKNGENVLPVFENYYQIQQRGRSHRQGAKEVLRCALSLFSYKSI